MKLISKFGLVALVVGAVFLWGRQASAQTTTVHGDTMYVTGSSSSGVIVDALYNAVMGDTANGGARLDSKRVYALMRGQIYADQHVLSNNGWTLRIVGQTPGSQANQFPPVVELNTVNGSADSHILQPYGNIYAKNIYFVGCDQFGVEDNYYQPIEVEGNNLTVQFDSCYFDRTFDGFIAWNGSNNNISFTNCEWRNLIGRPSSQQWEGRAISIWTDEDSVICQNNTYFNIGFTAFQDEGGSSKYVLFNHNTIVNLGRSVSSGDWWQTAYFTNNLLINPFWQGEGPADYSLALNPGRDPNAYYTGFFGIAVLPILYGPEAFARVGISHDYAYLDPYFRQKYPGDTVRIQPFTNFVTDSLANVYSPAKGGQIVISDTNWLPSYPSFKSNPDTIASVGLINEMYQNITDLRAGKTPAQSYFYGLPVNGSDTIWSAPSWPTPENFAYTNTSLMTAATDGLPIGNLNYFPTALASFKANEATDIQTAEQVAGKQKISKVDTTLQAEDGTPGGTAVVKNVPGFVYYYFNGGGQITWNFSLKQAISGAKLVIYVNCNGNTQKGQNLIVNGTYVAQTPSKYGQLMFDSPPLAADAWDSVTVTSADSTTNGTAWSASFPAGNNSIELQNSWGYDEFSGFALYDGSGSLVVKKGIPDAQYSKGQLFIVGSPWSPVGLKYDSLGSNGSITWSVPTASGSYNLNVSYQNYTSDQNLSLSVNGGTPITLACTANSDSSEQQVLSAGFTMPQGTNTLKLSGTGVNVDQAQLIAVITGVRTTPNTPKAFVLDQNYPNPFNPTTQIQYSLSKRVLTKLVVYDVLGQKVATLVDGMQNAGQHVVKFNGARYASGVYFYRLQAGSQIITRKMMMIK